MLLQTGQHLLTTEFGQADWRHSEEITSWRHSGDNQARAIGKLPDARLLSGIIDKNSLRMAREESHDTNREADTPRKQMHSASCKMAKCTEVSHKAFGKRRNCFALRSVRRSSVELSLRRESSQFRSNHSIGIDAPIMTEWESWPAVDGEPHSGAADQIRRHSSIAPPRCGGRTRHMTKQPLEVHLFFSDRRIESEMCGQLNL